MAPPNGVPSSRPREIPATPNVQEGPGLVRPDSLVPDPRWSDPSFRVQHLSLTMALEALHDYFSGKIPVEKLEKRLKAWTDSPAFADEANKDFYQGVVDRIHAQLKLFQSEAGAAKAQEVGALLPPATPPPEPPPTAEKPPAVPPAKPEAAEGNKGEKGDPNFSIGLEVHNDTFVSDVLLKKILQVNADAVLNEKTIFTLKAPVTFSGGPLKLMLRPYGGTFSSRALPGTQVGEVGGGYKIGGDIGVSNPYGKNFEASGLGFEVAGISSQAGEQNGVEAPGPVTRLHLFRQEDISINAGQKMQIGLNSFFNYQETFFILGGNRQLLESGGTDFSTAGNLFVANKFNLLGMSLRFYPNGVPQKDSHEDLKGGFRPGEAAAKIGSVAVGSQINRNRRRGIPPFANNRVFLGTFEPLGAQSRDQYDLLGTGLFMFSTLDGVMTANNANVRSEVWRRGNWVERGTMIALDAANLIADVAVAANAEDDPPTPQTPEEFAQNPGSVTDFEGRAGKMNLYLNLYELGLSGLDVSGALGRSYDENKLQYGLTHGALFLAGIPLFFFSAPLSGAECGPEGTALFRCGFGTTANTKGQYFSSDTFDAGPEDIRQVERQYMVSSIGASLMTKGAGGLFHWVMDAGKEKGPVPAGKSEQQTAFVPTFNFNIGPQGGMVRVGGRF